MATRPPFFVSLRVAANRAQEARARDVTNDVANDVTNDVGNDVTNDVSLFECFVCCNARFW